MELVDTHCHLDDEPLVADLEKVLGRARGSGVTRVVAPAFDVVSWTNLERIALGCAGGEVRIALGLHPWVAGERLEADDLRRRIERSRAVAIGEIGLDFRIPLGEPGRTRAGEPVPAPTRERQQEVFVRQLELAVELDLPVILHCRGAFEEMLGILAALPRPPAGVVHAWSKGPGLMKRFLDLGLFVAFGGAVTRLAAERARASARLVPTDRMLLETDAPSIGLEGIPPEQVEPRHVAEVAAALAASRGEPVERIAEATTANASRLFRFG
jgi:TatD DNase family protein